MSGNAREAGRTTIDRLLSLLDAFDGADLSLAEVAERSRLPLTTAHRMLGALQAWGGVERGPSGRYRVGLRIWELGTKASAPVSLREIALPVLQELCAATRENVQLAIRDHHSALVIERLAGPRAARTRTEVGGRLPLHATGVGKVLLAAEPALLRELIAVGLCRYTRHTMVMPGGLAASLARTRATGIATVIEEMTLGTNSLAAPVTDAGGTVRAALGVVGPSYVPPMRYAAALRSAALQVSRRVAAAEAAAQGRAVSVRDRPPVRSGR
jgi:DNA-binding IclR family transcriptional regulator